MINSAVPPCLPEYSDRSTEVPTHFLPDNAGIASEDTKDAPFSLPSAAHLLLRFSPRSQPPGLSVDALAALLPLLRFRGYLI